MSMMMPPDPAAAGGMPLPPGGGGDVPPMDAMSSSPLPAEGGIQALMAALQGGGGDPGGGAGIPGGLEGQGFPGGANPDEALPADGSQDMSATDHIQQAIKHLMLAMVANDDQEQSAGIVKGMGPLQALLGGEQKKDKLLASAGG